MEVAGASCTRFHNDTVRAARALRTHRTVRLFRLAGHAPFPLAFEMDDAPPAALGPNSAHACGTLPEARTWFQKMPPAALADRPGT